MVATWYSSIRCVDVLDAMINRYMEAASEGVPLRFVIAFLISFVALASPPESHSHGVVEAILQARMLELLSMPHWQAVDPRIGDGALAAALVVVGVLAERGITTAFLRMANRSSKYREKVAETYKQLGGEVIPLEARSTRLQLLEGTIKPTARRFSRSVCASQLAFSTGCTVLFCGGSSLDVVVAVTLIAFGMFRAIASGRIFIAEYFPLIALRSVLQGMPVPANLARPDS